MLTPLPRHRTVMLCLFGLLLLPIPRSFAAPPADLTLTSVTLYSAGKGVFKYEGSIDSDCEFRMSIPESEVSYVIRSLGAVDPLGKFAIRIGAAPDPIRPREELPETETLSDVLLAMRGQHVSIAVRGGKPIDGRLVAIEMRDEVVGDLILEREALTLLNDDGLQTLELVDVETIQAQDPTFQARLHRALDQRDPNTTTSQRDVVVSFQGNQERKVEVVVTREVPVWKCTYRATESELVLRSVVQNTTDTPWENIRLDMIDGAPISFNVDLDRVVRLSRPDVDLSVDAPPVSPDLAESITQRIARGDRIPRRADLRADEGNKEKKNGFGGGFFGGGMGSMGMDPFVGDVPFGNAPTDDPFGPSTSNAASGLGISSGTSKFPPPTNETYGAMLIINAKDISVGARETLLIDTALKPVEIGLVSVYRHHYHATKPTLSLEITHNGPSRLPQGPLTVLLNDRGYAGEAVLPQASPRIPRLVGFALDDGIRVARSKPKHSSAMQSLKIDPDAGSILEETRHQRTFDYQLANRGKTPRLVIIDHPRPDKPFEVAISDEREVETTATTVRFQRELIEGESTRLSVEESHNDWTKYDFGTVSLKQLRDWIRNQEIEEETRSILKTVLDDREQLDDLNELQSKGLATSEKLAQEINRVTQQLKLPENVSLPNVLIERYQDRLIRLEDERDAAMEETESLSAKIHEIRIRIKLDSPNQLSPYSQRGKSNAGKQRKPNAASPFPTANRSQQVDTSSLDALFGE